MQNALRLHEKILAVVLAALAVGAASSACAESRPTLSVKTGVCQPERSYPAGLSERQIESNGRIRSYRIYVPRSYTGKTAVPVVLDLHASSITPEIELRITNMDSAAEKNGFIVVLPVGVTKFARGGTTWNIPFEKGVDDVAFVTDVLDAVGKALCVDQRRVYAIGYSGGARLASQLACQMPDRIAAIGAVGGLRHPRGSEGQCRNAEHTVPIIAFHSVDDPINLYKHDPARSPPYWTYGVDEALTRWAKQMECSTKAEAEQITAKVCRLTYADCRDGARIVLYRLSGSGHTWPGSDFSFPEYLGKTERAIDATELAIQFFEETPSPEGQVRHRARW